MQNKYEPDRHVHLEYSENKMDVEAVAFKLKSSQKWDVFFSYEEHSLRTPASYKEKDTQLGIIIFSVSDEKELYGKFMKWASDKIIPLL